jgi:hypothetical protein
MMRAITIHPLCDGPISLDAFRERRIAKVAEMAAVLLLNRSYVDRYDALLTLRACGYSEFEIQALAPDACQASLEHVVAMEMSEQ